MFFFFCILLAFFFYFVGFLLYSSNGKKRQNTDKTNRCFSRSRLALSNTQTASLKNYKTWPHCCILTFGPGKHAIPNWCTGRKWHIPIASNRKRSRGRIWLMKWDKVKKSYGTLIDWCTGREWPVNCMTVISAWWRSNMPFQRLSGRLSWHWTII